MLQVGQSGSGSWSVVLLSAKEGRRWLTGHARILQDFCENGWGWWWERSLSSQEKTVTAATTLEQLFGANAKLALGLLIPLPLFCLAALLKLQANHGPKGRNGPKGKRQNKGGFCVFKERKQERFQLCSNSSLLLSLPGYSKEMGRLSSLSQTHAYVHTTTKMVHVVTLLSSFSLAKEIRE